MATRQLLTELVDAFGRQTGVDAVIESVGGIDAVRRVRNGEPFDVVVLAADAIIGLIATGHLLAGSRHDLVRSPVAIAVPAGVARLDISSETALRAAVLDAPAIGYSTGPSGTALLKLFERWGVADTIRERVVQAPPGVPVAKLVADGKVALGFQQLSEMLTQDGITVLGAMPPGAEIVTTFSAGICAKTSHPGAARELIEYMQSPAAAAAKRRHGMEPA